MAIFTSEHYGHVVASVFQVTEAKLVKFRRSCVRLPRDRYEGFVPDVNVRMFENRYDVVFPAEYRPLVVVRFLHDASYRSARGIIVESWVKSLQQRNIYTIDYLVA